MAPSPVDTGEGIPREESYVITADDILGLRLTAQLVVLNLGYNPYRKDTLPCGFLLPNAFIAAGMKQCVANCIGVEFEKIYFIHKYLCVFSRLFKSKQPPKCMVLVNV